MQESFVVEKPEFMPEKEHREDVPESEGSQEVLINKIIQKAKTTFVQNNEDRILWYLIGAFRYNNRPSIKGAQAPVLVDGTEAAFARLTPEEKNIRKRFSDLLASLGTSLNGPEITELERKLRNTNGQRNGSVESQLLDCRDRLREEIPDYDDVLLILQETKAGRRKPDHIYEINKHSPATQMEEILEKFYSSPDYEVNRILSTW